MRGILRPRSSVQPQLRRSVHLHLVGLGRSPVSYKGDACYEETHTRNPCESGCAEPVRERIRWQEKCAKNNNSSGANDRPNQRKNREHDATDKAFEQKAHYTVNHHIARCYLMPSVLSGWAGMGVDYRRYFALSTGCRWCANHWFHCSFYDDRDLREQIYNLVCFTYAMSLASVLAQVFWCLNISADSNKWANLDIISDRNIGAVGSQSREKGLYRENSSDPGTQHCFRVVFSVR